MIMFMKCRRNGVVLMSKFRLVSTKPPEAGPPVLRIGNVAKPLSHPVRPELVPRCYVKPGELRSLAEVKCLKWLLEKDLLKQDVFLIGPPGLLRRSIAMRYLELTRQEYEYLSLTRDTTESDIKQRREIRDGSAFFEDQCAVRAALEGRVLIIEGIEKAERNVLPILNNLLENREMNLDDGRLLVSPEKFDFLLKDHTHEQLEQLGIRRVSDKFRVIALGLPVPKYRGNSLDPPLRSRFQSYHVGHTSFKEMFERVSAVAPNVPSDKLSQVVSFMYALQSPDVATLSLPEFPLEKFFSMAELWNVRFKLPATKLVEWLYPYRLMLKPDGQEYVRTAMDKFDLIQSESANSAEIVSVKVTNAPNTGEVQTSDGTVAKVPVGPLLNSSWSPAIDHQFVPTAMHNDILTDMVMLHSKGDFCLVGAKGCGKTALVHEMGKWLGYSATSIMLFQDMTSIDFLQRRFMLHNGDTAWKYSSLIEAALSGDLAILDGIHRVHHSTLSTLHRLVHDRELELFDGTRLMGADKYKVIQDQTNLTDPELQERKIFPIHPSFRIVALAEPPNLHDSSEMWLTPELLTLFPFIHLPSLSGAEEMNVIAKRVPGLKAETEKRLLNFVSEIRGSSDANLRSLGLSLSTRQLIRIMKRMTQYPDQSLGDSIEKPCMSQFLPSLTRVSLREALEKAGLKSTESTAKRNESIVVTSDMVTIGNVSRPIVEPSDKTLVPNILFYENAEHIRIMEDMLRDMNLGEHLLLIGNQGVGKNKIADRFLQLLKRPRQYIQLHRDTTVQTLTLQTSVKNGIVSYEDSPLVKAVKLGHILVVDECDKASTHVTCVLKSLLESGEMHLADGRRIIPVDSPLSINELESEKFIRVHPEFRMIVLANRPGFPFLGNDFYGALGDLFACHAVDNPSSESELKMLQQYGPTVPLENLRRLSSAFSELRELALNNQLTYPYSIRELVNIVKHLEKFPQEPLNQVVKNVFDFDEFNVDAKEKIIDVLIKHGIPFGKQVKPEIRLAKRFPIAEPKLLCNWGASSSSPVICKMTTGPLKNEKSYNVAVKHFPVERAEARVETFSELNCLWQLPLHQTNIVSHVSVLGSDNIVVSTVNPLGVYVLNTASNICDHFDLFEVFPNTRRGDFQPRLMSYAGLEDRLLLHDESSNLMGWLDLNGRKFQFLNSGNFTTLKKFSKIIKGDPKSLPDQFRLVKVPGDGSRYLWYQMDNSELRLIDFQNGIVNEISLPTDLAIRQCFTVNESSALLKSFNGNFHLVRFPSVNDGKSEVSVKPVDMDQWGRQDGQQLMSSFDQMSSTGMTDMILQTVVQQKISSPNRLFGVNSPTHFGAVSIGFPELEMSGELLVLERPTTDSFVSQSKPFWLAENDVACLPATTNVCAMPKIAQIVRLLPSWETPANAFDKSVDLRSVIASMEICDLVSRQVAYLPLMVPRTISPHSAWISALTRSLCHLTPFGDEKIVSVDVSGGIKLWETSGAALRNSKAAWQKMFGIGEHGDMQITYEGNPIDLAKLLGLDPKHGILDPTGAPHHGGNTFAGGSGGRDTAGLGGVGGPYRLDLGHPVYQVSDEVKAQVPEHILKKSREIARKAYLQRLKEIQMSEFDGQLYDKFYQKVHRQITQLRIVLDSLQAKSKERQWLRHQTSGDLDEAKLIDGLTGEKTIFRRRADRESEPGSPMVKPKRIRICADVSGSMYRFNGLDQRLEKSLEACLMVMEALEGYEDKLKYEIVGHSGETPALEFVSSDKPPKNKKERLDILKAMLAHTQFCYSGDHTIEAAQLALKEMPKQDADEYFLILLSDANLDRYGIRPSHLAAIFNADSRINVFAILIGSLGDQAAILKKNLPAGRAFVCRETSEIPNILQQIFTSNLLQAGLSSSS